MKLHAFDADNNLLYSCHHSDTEKLVNMMCNHEVSAVSCGDAFVWREGYWMNDEVEVYFTLAEVKRIIEAY